MTDDSRRTGMPAKPITGGLPALWLAGLFVLGSILLMDAAAPLLHAPPMHRLLRYWLHHRADHDSWFPMILAYAWLQEPHTGTLYQGLFFSEHVKFQYPPTALLPLAAIEALGRWPSEKVFNSINWFVFAFTVLAAGAFALVAARRAEAIPVQARLASASVAVVAALATAAFFPLIRSYVLGQAQTAIDLAFALACLCWLCDRRLAAGILIGAICLVKPQFALLLLWGGFRRQWPFLIGWCIVALPALALSIALFGITNHLDYLEELRFISSHGETYYPNQSMNGLLNRMVMNGDSLVWSEGNFAPYHPLVHLGGLLTSAILILAALFLRGRRPDRGGLLDFMTATLTFTMASPVAWEHHYGILPPILIALLFALLTAPAAGRTVWLWVALAAAYVASANFFPIANLAAASWFNFVQSYLFFAALAVLWLLYRVEAPDWLRRQSLGARS